MKVKYKKKWLKALRDGKYKQGTRVLYDKDDNSYCCLGVLCKITRVKIRKPFYLTDNLLDKFGITDKEQKYLASLNDDDHRNFVQIADYIESNL